MYYKHHTKGIVLYSFADISDNRRIVIFTENFGIISVKAQGARGMQSKLRSGIQEFSFGDFSLVKGKSGWKVVGVNVKCNFFEDFRDDKYKLSITKNVLFFLFKNIGVEDCNKEIFEITSNFMLYLRFANNVHNISVAESLVMLRIIHNLGFLKHDPEVSTYLPLSNFTEEELKLIAPNKSKIIKLINESIKSSQLFGN